ncbi:hypothetical protein LPJ61_003984, partial [Coemansia biformis]
MTAHEKDTLEAGDGGFDGLGNITMEVVLQGLQSLDEFERQAALHTDGRCMDDPELLAELHGSHAPPAGLGSFSEEELSAALEQIYWGSLEMPLVDPSEISAHQATEHADSLLSSSAPTPASTPVTASTAVSAAQAPMHTDTWGESSAPGESPLQPVGGDDSDGDDNPLELEELSLFSLFLADMKAFESFLRNLSLNQLRQCAATVNSVLVQRESMLEGANQGSPADARCSREPDAASILLVADEADDGGSEAAYPDQAGSGMHGREKRLLPSTVSLLREWLPPSTADCVITALQAANLDILAEPQRLPSPHAPAPGPSTAAARPNFQSAEGGARGSNSQHFGSSSAAAAVGHEHGDALHANDPHLYTDGEGTPWLSFVYAQKGKPRRHRIRIDIERAPLTVIPPSFRSNNCVYPRANCPKATYAGNRWGYETECNGIGWKLAFLNQELLAVRRGLLQTAVNNYRSMVAGRKSRRIARMEKAERTSTSAASSSWLGRNSQTIGAAEPVLMGAKRPLLLAGPTAVSAAEKRTKTSHGSGGPSGALQQQATPPPTATSDSFAGAAVAAVLADDVTGVLPGGQHAAAMPLARTTSTPSLPSSTSAESAKCLLITAYVNSKFARIRVYIDLGSIDAVAVDRQFKNDHAVFPRALNAPRARYGSLQGRWEFELTCNELAWRLAWLNKARLRGRKPLIQKCLDAYRERF